MLYFFTVVIGILLGAVVTFLLIMQRLGSLRRRLYSDKLTGLKNTNYLEDYFYKFLQPKTSYILIDIDNFKDFNTKYGYEIADRVLSHFVNLTRKQLQPGDEMMRYKFGDEFLIVLKNKSKNDALTFLGHLRIVLNKNLLMVHDNNLFLQFSAGVTSFKENSEQTTIISELMESLGKAKKMKDCDVAF
jgi:diguanylate cyclase (GGDEF)-like protein